ncbi:MAG: glycosyltransferase family 39 protein [Anaerolineae bacterium]|nr:glycosyltransferase family 39 protein [Anaerolineae bacterium]
MNTIGLLKRFSYSLLSSIHYPLSSIFHPLLLLWLLTLPAITPLLQPTLTRSADGLLHLYRVVALDQLIRQGVFFFRWLPDLAFGYGLPLFVFYAPLSYYLTEGLHLIGLDMVGAFNISGALALLVAGSGVYLLVKDWLGAKAGLLAGVAYVYAPYQLFNLYSRGSLPVTWAGALFPLAFWAFGRLIRTNQPTYLPLSALLCGAALLMHNISNLLFLPLLIFFLGIELVFTRTPHHGIRNTQYAILRVSLALSLGLALAAFFWLPATLEKEFAQVQRVITPPDFDYHSNFVSLGQLFSLPQPANTGLLNPTDPLTLGLAHVTLAAIGLLAVLFYLWKQRDSGEFKRTQGVAPRLPCSPAPLLFAVVGLVVAIFMMLPVSVGVWDRLPLIAFVQQPHRLLSVTAFLLAVLAGVAVAALPNRLSFSLTVGGVMLVLISTVPLLYPRYYASLPAPPTLTGMMAYERATGAIGTTSFGEYLPIWVQQIPHDSPLESLYQTGAAIERLDHAYLPAGARVESAVYSFNRADLTINAPESYQAVFHTFYFPGWQAEVDNQPAPLAPVTERGLVGVTMPAGQHRLLLQFGETPIRQAANTLSLVALVVVIGLGFRAYRHLHPLSLSFKGNGGGERVPDFSSSQVVLLLALALAFLLTKTLYLDHFDNPLKRVFDGTHGTGAKVSRQVNFGRQVNLLGYDLDQPQAASGQTFDLTLYWQARQPLAMNYSALAQLVDGQQHLFAGQDNLHPGGLPTSRWEPWGFVQDKHAVQVPPGTPPGGYFLVAGLYDPATWARLPVVVGGEPGWSDVLPLPVTVTRPTNPPTLAELGITWPAPHVCQQQEDTLTNFHPSSLILHPCLLGATPERETIQRSDFLRVALFWEAVETPVPDYQVSLRFLAADDTVPLAETSRPSFGRYPMPQWTAGERVRDNHALWVPADFPAGTFRLQVQVVDETGQPLGDWLELGQLTALEVQ